MRNQKVIFHAPKIYYYLESKAFRSWSKREVNWEKEKEKVFEAKWLMFA